MNKVRVEFFVCLVFYACVRNKRSAEVKCTKKSDCENRCLAVIYLFVCLKLHRERNKRGHLFYL